MLTVADGSERFVTARQRPPLLMVQPRVDGDQLCFDAPGMEDRLCIPIEPDISTLVRRQPKYDAALFYTPLNSIEHICGSVAGNYRFLH